MDASLDNMEARLVPQSRSNQQFAMTSINNLTLMLNWSAQPNAAATGAKQNGGNGKLQKARRHGKETIALKTSQRAKGVERKNETGKKSKWKRTATKPGPKPGKPGQGDGMSEQLAKMAAQQEYLRNELNKVNLEDNKDGKKFFGQSSGHREANGGERTGHRKPKHFRRNNQAVAGHWNPPPWERKSSANATRMSTQERRSKNYQHRNPPELSSIKN